MDSINPTALDIAFERAQKVFDTAVKAKQQFAQGLDARDAVKGNVADAQEKLFGKSGFANSIQTLPEEDRAAFAQAALKTVRMGSRGKNTSIVLQTAYINSVADTLEKLKGVNPVAFADTLKDDLRDTVQMPLSDSGVVYKGPHIPKASLSYASDKAFETMTATVDRREEDFRRANKDSDVSDADITRAFSDRFSAAAGHLFHNKSSVMGRLHNAQSSGQVKVILDDAYSGIAKQSKTMQPLIEATLDSFVKALGDKEPQFSYQKPAKARGV